MIPKRILLENFLSFGAPAVEIGFTDDEPLWVLGGPNGVGKSAVFDAMTYALYAEHRGGASDHASLIRHGANGFRIVFEFEFSGIDYRITRTRSGKTTQKVERRDPNRDAWEPVANVNSASEVKAWSERTLGLGFSAFTASVLLRQGHADEIITATGGRRLEILKKIISVERYEALSKRVHDMARTRKGRLEDLQTQRNGTTPVTEADVNTARAALAEAEAARSTARVQLAASTERLTAAKQWAKLEPQRRSLMLQIQGADTRAADAERIRANKARLDELTHAAPVLRQVAILRPRIATSEILLMNSRATIGQLTIEREQLQSAADQETQKATAHRAKADEQTRQAKSLREGIARDNGFIAAAEGAATLKVALAAFPHDLADQLAQALGQVQTATDKVSAAATAKAEAVGLLRQARAQQQKFATVGVGVNCSLCGQKVTAEHAERERVSLAHEVGRLEQTVRDADSKEKAANQAKSDTEGARDHLEARRREHDGISQRLAAQLQTLAALGVTANADELRALLTVKIGRAEVHETNGAAETKAGAGAASRAEGFVRDVRNREARLGELDRQIRVAEQTAASERARHDTLTGRLAPQWSSILEALDEAAVDALDAEYNALAASGVAGLYSQLEQDAARRDEWVKQLDELIEPIEAIPETSRVPEAVAMEAAKVARNAATDADESWETAKDADADLTRRAAICRKLADDIAAAETQSDLHHKLDDLLGKGGLQRELVRTAEHEIVRLANDTLQNLSDGGLSVELDDGADGADEAFALRVRETGAPAPTGVNFLSGSQKFRVAISVALAIGRFAAGQARPLESVIIDEGFGSLDKDGLRAAADELNRLRQHLRRIVLVSHQEEFADRFPVVIKLSQGENGAVAEAVRR